jgi:hypothetical protein
MAFSSEVRERLADARGTHVPRFAIDVAKATSLCEPVFDKRPIEEHRDCQAVQGETDVRTVGSSRRDASARGRWLCGSAHERGG